MHVEVKKVVSHDALHLKGLVYLCQGAILRIPEKCASLLHTLLHATGPHLVCVST